MSASATGSSRRRAAIRWRSSSCRGGWPRRSCRARSGWQGRTRCPGGSRRASCGDSRRSPRRRVCSCWSLRRSPSTTLCSCGARPSDSASGSLPRLRTRPKGCWRSANVWRSSIRWCARRSIDRRRSRERRAVHRTLAQVTDAAGRRGPSCLAPRRSGTGTRRGGRLRARAVGWTRAGARRARRGGRLPAALGRADARPCATRGPRAGSRASQPARGGVRRSARVAGHSGGGDAGRAPVRPGGLAARASRVGHRRDRGSGAAAEGGQAARAAGPGPRARDLSRCVGRSALRRSSGERRRSARRLAGRPGRAPADGPSASVRSAARRPRGARHRRARRSSAGAEAGSQRVSRRSDLRGQRTSMGRVGLIGRRRALGLRELGRGHHPSDGARPRRWGTGPVVDRAERRGHRGHVAR